MKPEDVLKSIEKEAPTNGWPIIGPKRGLILDEVVQKYKPSAILEVGTNVGYSAIRMGRLLKKGQKVTCVEISEALAKTARSNTEKAGLSDRIEILVGDAKKVLPRLEGTFDMVFLDAVKTEYIDYLKSIERLLHRGSVVAADNVKQFADELTPYLEYVRHSGNYESSYREAPSNWGNDEGDAVEVSVRI